MLFMTQYNKYIQYLKSTQGARDHIFEHCLSLFKNGPIFVLEIGASRDISHKSRFSDGWSTIFLALYIEKYGGKITIVDIDEKALINCKHLVEGIEAEINFVNADANTYIANINDTEYNLIYLDGSDDPKEMLYQFEKINRKHTSILCDDFSSKGSLLRQKYSDYQLLLLTDTVFEMAIYERIP